MVRKVWIVLDDDVLVKLAIVKAKTRIPQYQIINKVLKVMNIEEIVRVVKDES